MDASNYSIMLKFTYMELTPEEKNLVEYAKEAIVKYNKIRHAPVE